MKTAHVVAVMLNGEKHDVVGVYMALGDRIEYERRYGSSIFAKGKVTREADGTSKAELDTGAIDEESRTYFVWKMLKRAELPVGDFDDFWPDLEKIEGPEFLEGPADPTDEGLQPGSSPS